MRRVPSSRDSVLRNPAVAYASTITKKGAAAAGAAGLPRFASVAEAVAALRPEQPMYCYFPRVLEANAARFLTSFPGKTLYAVKSNTDPFVLQTLYNAGIRHFDVASLPEVRQIAEMFPGAMQAFMHPVKSREAIRAAYFDYGVRIFVLDCLDELKKIREETKAARDLTLVVRLAMPKGSAVVSLAGKFGAPVDQAPALLRDVKKTAARVGVAFHVGQQTLDPSSYIDALRIVRDVTARAGVALDIVDVGGGFPVEGLGNAVHPLEAYFDAIRQGLAELALPESCEVWGEPGRALCGTGGELVARVELRKDDALYLNDGSYGAFFDMCWMGLHNDMTAIAAPGRKAPLDATMEGYRFFGPTCASEDKVPGPYALPRNMAEGDYIQVHSMGGYASVMQTRFNGFYSDLRVEIVPPDAGKLLHLRAHRRK
jgi:ornithine decarboxylase